MPSVLFLGASGYIGSAVFNAFINAHPALEFTALVRTPSHASHIRAAVNTIVGSLEEHERLVELASEADVVVNVARADDVRAAEALVEGLRLQKEKGGKTPVVIHTCGMDVFDGRDVWDDTSEECIRQLLRHPVESTLIAAEREGILRAYFIAPTLVFGLNVYKAPSPIYLAAIRTLLSLPSPPPNPTKPPAAHPVLLRGRGGGGDGGEEVVLGMVHIDDLAGLFLLVLDGILKPDMGRASEDKGPHVYIASSSERTHASISQRIIHALQTRGLLGPDSHISVSSYVLPQLIPTASTSLTRESYSTSTTDTSNEVPSEQHFLACRAAGLGWIPEKPNWERDVDWDIDRALQVLKVTVPKS